jgi:hypothetical protein
LSNGVGGFIFLNEVFGFIFILFPRSRGVAQLTRKFLFLFLFFRVAEKFIFIFAAAVVIGVPHRTHLPHLPNKESEPFYNLLGLWSYAVLM